MRWITCLACTRSHLLPYEDPERKQLLAVRIIHCSLLRFCSHLMLYYLTLVFLYIHFSRYTPIYSLYAIVGFLKIPLSSMSCSLPVNRGKLRCLAIILIILNVTSSTRNGMMEKNQGEFVSKKIPSQLH